VLALCNIVSNTIKCTQEEKKANSFQGSKVKLMHLKLRSITKFLGNVEMGAAMFKDESRLLVKVLTMIFWLTHKQLYDA